MIDQTLVDTLADKLVQKGELVSYSSVQAALQEHNKQPSGDAGKGASYRDLHTLLTDWRDRRRYKGHLAALKMPEKMEKALAVFAARAMKAAEDRARAGQEPAPTTPDTLAVMAQMERLVGRLEEQMAGLAAENRSLREGIAALRPTPVVVANVTVPGPPRPGTGVGRGASPRPPHASSGTGLFGSCASRSGAKAPGRSQTCSKSLIATRGSWSRTHSKKSMPRSLKRNWKPGRESRAPPLQAA